MKTIFLFLSLSTLSLSILSCEDDPIELDTEGGILPNNVGDIEFDPKLDDFEFQTCSQDEIPQYYNFYGALMYEGEKYALDEQIYRRFKEKKRTKNESGYITIRFVVNCNGETGRFRTIQMDSHYSPKEFDKSIVEQLQSITKSLDGWLPAEWENAKLDYYQHLTFKIERGKITDILP